MRDFRGNEINVGDVVVYAPTNRYSGLVEAEVLEVESVDRYGRPSWVIKVQPLREACWNCTSADRRAGRTVQLTNTHRILKVGDGTA